MNATYSISKSNTRRRRIYRAGPTQSRSFVKAFLQFMYCSMANLSQNVVDITATSQSIDNASEAYISVLHDGLESGATQLYSSDGNGGLYRVKENYAGSTGIVVGTSSTAVAVADDNLVAQATHGSGAGQLVHYGCYGLNYTTGASTATFDIEREYRNDSGGSIVITEIGIYAITDMRTGNTGKTFCIMRDVISPTVTVANTEYLKVKYTLQVSV